MSIEGPGINPIEKSGLYQMIRRDFRPIKRRESVKKWASIIVKLYEAMPLALKEEYRQYHIKTYNFDVIEYIKKQERYLENFKTTVIRKRK